MPKLGNNSLVKKCTTKIKADVDRLYIPRRKGGRGLIQLQLSHKTSTIGLFQYLNNTHDWMLQMVNLHESTKKLHFVKKESDKFSRELELEIDNDNPLKPTEIARKSKKLNKSAGVEQLELKMLK